MTFWDHLDELRNAIIRCLLVIVVFSCLFFVFKEETFRCILAPTQSDFITYRWFEDNLFQSFDVQLINTELASQFLVHLKVAFSLGILLASPYILYEILRFILPALYQNERKYVLQITLPAYLLFFLGILLAYGLIFPFTFRFLATYQVADSVPNLISLQSYISTLIMLSFCMGVVFLLPIICFLLGKMGLLSRDMMTIYRRHAIVAILVIAAIITPTADVFTLLLVSLPIYILYEISILLVPIKKY